MSIEFITKVAFTSNTSQHSVTWPSHHSHTQPQTSNHPNDTSQLHPPITPTTNHANHPFLSNHLWPPTTTSTTSDMAMAQMTWERVVWAYSMFFLIILFYFANTLNLTASCKPSAGMQPPWPITWLTRPLQPTMTHNTTYATPATHHNPHHDPHNPHNPQPPPMWPLQPTKPHTQHMTPEMGPDNVGHIVWALAILFGV